LAPSNVSVGIYNDDGYALTTRVEGRATYYNFIDIYGNTVLDEDIRTPGYYFPTPSLSDGMVRYYQNGLYGYINTDSGKVLNQQYYYADNFSEGLAYVETKPDRGGYIDKDGNVVIPFRSRVYGSMFTNGLAENAAFRRGEYKCGLIDTNGKWVVEAKYRICIKSANYNIWELKRDRFSSSVYDLYFVDLGVTALNYWSVSFLSPTQFIGNQGYYSYYVTVSKEQITRSTFDYISYIGDMSEGLLSVKQDGLWGYIDINGNLIVDFQFDEVQPFSEGLAAVCLDGKWGYIANPLVYPAWDPDEIKRSELLGLIDTPASDEPITCGEFASLLERAFEMENGTLNSIVSEPGTLLTRGIAATFISRTAEEQGKYYRYFLPDSDDRASISEELKFQIGFVIQTGIVKLHDYNYNEYNEVQRDEAYRILLRTFEYLLS